MTQQLKDEITSEFEAIRTEWPNVYCQTKAKISTMKNYYSNIQDTSQVVQKTDEDYESLKTDLERHKDLAARGSAIKRDLTTQVESSENRVQKMIKYGRPAAVGFAILGALIGGDIGGKSPGWGQVAAIVLGRLLGLIIFGVISFVLYFISKWRLTKKRDMWKNVHTSNEGAVELVAFIKDKKSCLSDIRNLLNDIEDGNMVSGCDALLKEMAEYLKEATINHGQLNQV